MPPPPVLFGHPCLTRATVMSVHQAGCVPVPEAYTGTLRAILTANV
jgi:hypothetical protein